MFSLFTYQLHCGQLQKMDGNSQPKEELCFSPDTGDF